MRNLLPAAHTAICADRWQSNRHLQRQQSQETRRAALRRIRHKLHQCGTTDFFRGTAQRSREVDRSLRCLWFRRTRWP